MIIYLNGPSSCGKTTLAKALQSALDEPYLHVGIDKVIGFMPPKINNWESEIPTEGFFWKAALDPTGHPVYDIQMGPFAKRISQTLRDLVLLLAHQGYNLIIDDVAFDGIEVQGWKEVLKDFQVLYVGITIPLPILEEREKSRGDRFHGTARAQYFKVHQNADYDLEIDTHAHSLEENVALIKKLLK